MNSIPTIDIYEEVRKHKDSSDPLKAEDYNVLVSVESVIYSVKKVDHCVPSAVEYFSCIMSTLHTNPSCYRSLLHLLSIVIMSVSDNVKRMKCNDCLEVLVGLYSNQNDSFEPSAIRSLATCVESVLVSQELIVELWDSGIVKKSFALLLGLCCHENGKVRRHAQDTLQELLQYHFGNGFVVSSQFVVRQLEILSKGFNANDYHVIVFYLSFLSRVALTLHPDCYSSLVSVLFKLCGYQANLLTCRALRPLEIILDSDHAIEDPVLLSTYHDLLSSSVSASSNDKDIQQYVQTTYSAIRRVMREGIEDVQQSFVNLTHQTMLYFLTSNSVLHKQISIYLMAYYPTLNGELFHQDTVQQLVNLYQSTLQFKYQHAWIYILPAFSAFIRAFGCIYPNMFMGIVEQLVAIYDSAVRGDISFQLLLTKTIGICIETMGPQIFTSSFRLIDPQNGLPDESHYFIFELLLQHCKQVSCSLSFFFTYLIPIAKACHNAAMYSKNPVEQRRYHSHVVDIWSLFVSFCVCANDTESAIPQYHSRILAALGDTTYRELSVVISKGLILLIRSNQFVLKDDMIDNEEEENEEESESDSDEKNEENMKEKDEEEEMVEMPFLEILKSTHAPRILRDVAQKNLSVLQQVCPSFLEVLFPLYTQWHGDYSEELPRYSGIGKGGDITSVEVIRCCIESLFSIASTEIVSNMLQDVVGKLLNAFTKKDGEDGELYLGQGIVLTGLLSTLLQFVQDSDIPFILRCLRSHLNDETCPILQKRVYYCLLCLCRYHGLALVEGELLETVASMFTDSVLTLNVASKKNRLRCLYYLIKNLSTSSEVHIQFLIQRLPEIILYMKDSSKKIRSICFELIIIISDYMNHANCDYSLPDGSTAHASLNDFFRILSGGLAAESSHMQAASLMCISSVLFHYKKEQDMRDVEMSILHIVYYLLPNGNREIMKACMKYIRTCSKVMNEDDLHNELEMIMKAIMVMVGENKNRFRQKIRTILEILVRRLGSEEVKMYMPEEDLPLLNNILRAERRKENSKKKEEESEEEEPIERSKHWIKEGEDPLDLLNIEDVTKGVHSKRYDDEDDSEIEVDDQGRFVVREEESEEEKKEEIVEKKDPSHKHAKRNEKVEKTERKRDEDGSRFRSSRAKGDMKKGNVQPYAYIKLDARLLSRKKKNQSLGRFNNLIGAAKRGAKEGSSRRRKN